MIVPTFRSIGRPSSLIAFLGATLWFLGSGCSQAPSGGGGNTGGTPCVGSHCSEGPCMTNSCGATAGSGCQVEGCPAGQKCQIDGSCTDSGSDIDVGSSGGSSSSASGGEGGAAACVDVVVTFTKVVPTVLLLIDRSRSMNDLVGFGEEVEAEVQAGSYTPWGCPEEAGAPPDALPQANYTWRWNVVRNVLFNPETGVVPKFQQDVQFGLALYTYQPDITPELCPELDQVDFSLGNASSLLAAMRCDDLGYKTPTREALEQSAAALHATESTGPKMIILATDGAPNSCECPSFTESQNLPMNCWPSAMVERDGEPLSPPQAEQFDVTAEAARIFQEWGIRISVIDVSSETDVDLRAHLTEVARAGGGKVYDGLKPTGLADAFSASVEEVRSCAVDLDGEIIAGYEDRGTVVLDDTPLTISTSTGEDGYRVSSSSRIELTGQPCEDLKSGDHTLSITFPCGTFEIVK